MGAGRSTSRMRSAVLARVSRSVSGDWANMRRTSGGNWLRNNALNSVAGSEFIDFMCCSNSEGRLSPKPCIFKSAVSFWNCVASYASSNAALRAAYFSVAGGCSMTA